ncbi:pectin acetylesterase 5-like [Octopus vulgaris]|uniref:Pectin acetylesterase 5-like n=2 Tax=Octopus TaxID=6643 RepID=A0AA36EXK3_OCTVU|nr:pectin acetylesterase 5 [Octopus sinensis]CAI9716782.1 pectin acetylesterase 5-like [Octopus vulgaris]
MSCQEVDKTPLSGKILHHSLQRQLHPESCMMFVPAKVSLHRPHLLMPTFTLRRCHIQLLCVILLVTIVLVVWTVSNLRNTFVSFHAESDTDGELVVLPEDFAKEREAFCLDGSPAGYYIRNGRGSSQNFWILHLQGGTWCSTESECYKRSFTEVGSSLKAPVSARFEGFMSSDDLVNPDFHDWNMVCFLYCDGGSFLGNRSQPIVYNSRNIYLRGASIFDAIIDFLLIETNLGSAKKVILSGSSAGGLAALIHADHLHQRLQKIPSFHAVLDAMLFLNLTSRNGQKKMMNILENTFHLHNIKDSVSLKDCSQSVPDEIKWQCFSPVYFYRHVFTPAFFLNSVHDRWYLNQALDITCDFKKCSSSDIKYISDIKSSLLDIVREIFTSHKDGRYLTACPVHSVLVNRFYSQPLAGHISPQKAIGDWYFGRISSTTKIIPREDIREAISVCYKYFNEEENTLM